MMLRRVLPSLLAFVLIAQQTYAQLGAPWEQSTNKRGQEKFEEIQRRFNAYWLDHDPTLKGSGYKPFKRWEEHWKYRLAPGGFLPRSEQLLRVEEQHPFVMKRGGLQWESKGPFAHRVDGSWGPGTGRVNVIAALPAEPDVLYVGTPAGGLWKSTDGGSSWEPKTLDLPSMGVSGIAIDPNNTATVYMSTGDRDGGDSYGTGIYKSTDGGSTWTRVLNFTGAFVQGGPIVMHPGNSDVLWAATTEGLFKTSNGGSSWSKVLNEEVMDVALNPASPNRVYAIGKENGRAVVRRSTNGGTSFSKVTAGTPTVATRIMLGVTPADSERVYLLSYGTASGRPNGFDGLYRSDDSGASFRNMNVAEDVFEANQGWYNLAIGVSSTDADVLFTGAFNVWKSTNGGVSFEKVNNWSSPEETSYTHADIHYLGFVGDALYAGTDGGIYRSTDLGTVFTDLSAGLNIGQYYTIACTEQRSEMIVGGLQDNGGYYYSGSEWVNFAGADGMETVIDPTNPGRYYVMVQNGISFYGTDNDGGDYKWIISAPAGQSGEWVTPVVATSDGSFLCGYGELYRLKNGQWTRISNLGRGRFDQLALDPNNEQNMYAAIDKDVYKSTNQGATWTLVKSFGKLVSSISINEDEGSKVYVTLGGYDFNNTSEKVFRSSNGGASWENISLNLPDVPHFVVKHVRGAGEVLYIGNDWGVYRYDDAQQSWTVHQDGMPRVPVHDIEILRTSEKIRIGTHGRGVWEAQLLNEDLVDGGSGDETGDNTDDNTGDDNNGDTGSGDNTDDTDGDNTAELPNYCTSKANNSHYIHMKGVAIGSQSFTSDDNGGYLDYTATEVEVASGATLTLTPGYAGTAYRSNFAAYVDWNLDGDFDDANERILNVGSRNSAVSGELTVPAGQALRTYRLRVVIAYESITIQPCGSYAFGETEDYTIKLIEGSTDQGGGDDDTVDNGDGDSNSGNNDEVPDYCGSSANNSYYIYMDKVELNDQVIATGDNGGYSNQADKQVDVQAGGSFDLTLRPGYPGVAYQSNFRGYIDWNKDGDFLDQGELVFRKGPANFGVKDAVQVPNVAAGNYRLRVIIAYESLTITPCGAYAFGETEDYTVRVVPEAAEGSQEGLLGDATRGTLTVYPNPTHDRLNVQLPEGALTYEVFSLQGQVVAAGKAQSVIDVSAFAPQTYYLRVKGVHDVYVTRFIVD